MPILLRALFVSLLLFLALSINAARADLVNLTGAETAPNIAENGSIADLSQLAKMRTGIFVPVYPCSL